MLHYFFAIIVLVHGLIHLMCFTHELQLTEREDISSDNIVAYKGTDTVLNIMWFIPYILFVATTILFMLYSNSWWMAGAAGVLLSEALIILDWREAKYGTIVNIIILLAIFANYGNWSFINI